MPVKTVNEVSKLSGVSVRTLHYYDKIGLLKPTAITGSGYRLYDDTTLERLQHILLFRELQFPLKDIKEILDSPDFDRNRALEQQIKLLELKKEHLETLIVYARGIKVRGMKNMDLSVFDTSKMDEYAKEAKEKWQHTQAYQEFAQRQSKRSKEEDKAAWMEFMKLFVEFGEMINLAPEDEKVQEQVHKLQDYITEHFYTCTPQILAGLGKMYAGGGEMTENIDKTGGKGTAEFAAQAIAVYTQNC